LAGEIRLGIALAFSFTLLRSGLQHPNFFTFLHLPYNLQLAHPVNSKLQTPSLERIKQIARNLVLIKYLLKSYTMAKSARASSKKNSRVKIRAVLHGPIHDARLQRLSDKLLAIASSEKPTAPTSTMEVDEDASRQPAEGNAGQEQVKGQMDLDQTPTMQSVGQGKRRIQKHSKGKRRASAVFPGFKMRGKAIQRKRK